MRNSRRAPGSHSAFFRGGTHSRARPRPVPVGHTYTHSLHTHTRPRAHTRQRTQSGPACARSEKKNNYGRRRAAGLDRGPRRAPPPLLPGVQRPAVPAGGQGAQGEWGVRVERAGGRAWGWTDRPTKKQHAPSASKTNPPSFPRPSLLVRLSPLLQRSSPLSAATAGTGRTPPLPPGACTATKSRTPPGSAPCSFKMSAPTRPCPAPGTRPARRAGTRRPSSFRRRRRRG